MVPGGRLSAAGAAAAPAAELCSQEMELDK